MVEYNFIDLAKNAKIASKKLTTLSTDIKNKALLTIAEALDFNKDKIFNANNLDLKDAEGKVSLAVLNRLKLDENKMRDMIQGVIDVYELEDPISKILMQRTLDTGLVLTKKTCPIGVLGIIFEARPDVISQISALAIKSSNAVILKGGKESTNTNKTIMEIIQTALNSVEGFPKNVLTQVFTRDDVKEML